VGHSVIAGFQIPKIDDVCTFSSATSDQIREWMAPGDSAHQIGPERCFNHLADCGGSGSMWDILL